VGYTTFFKEINSYHKKLTKFSIIVTVHLGIDFVENAIKKKGEIYLPGKRNALRRLQRRNPATGKVSGKSVSTEEWNAEKGIGNNITSLF